MNSQSSQLLPGWTTRRVVSATLLIITVALSFVLLYRVRMMVIIIFMGIVLSMAIGPAVTWCYDRRIPRAAAVIGIYLALLGIIAGFLALVVPLTFDQASALAPRLNDTYRDVRTAMLTTANPVIWQIGYQLPPDFALSAPGQPPNGNGQHDAGAALATVGQALAFVDSAIAGLFTIIGILILGFYWTLEGDRGLRALLMPLPLALRAETRVFVTEVEARVGAYIRGQALMAITIGLAAMVSYTVIGLPSPAALGLIAGVMEVVPVLGPVLGAIPALLVTWAVDPSKLVWVILAFSLIQFIESNILGPRIMHRTVGVNPVVTLLSIVAFGSLFGFPGLLLAIPLAAIIQLVINRTLLDPSRALNDVAMGRDWQARLRYEARHIVLDVHKFVRGKQADIADGADQVEDEIEAIAADLDRLLATAGPEQRYQT